MFYKFCIVFSKYYKAKFLVKPQNFVITNLIFKIEVKSVLEAVNILLSDRNSPFICLIAIDSRIANECFMTPNENKNVNGHEYLKKIINVPFCIPEVC